jgi:hypothetical protein
MKETSPVKKVSINIYLISTNMGSNIPHQFLYAVGLFAGLMDIVGYEYLTWSSETMKNGSE